MNTPPPLPSEIPGRAEPMPTGDRDLFPDVARGAAIFGILLVNMMGFKSPSLVSAMTGEPWLPGTWNLTVIFLIDWLATGKFVPIFTFLFGIGVALQYRRAMAAGRPFNGFLARRMVFLALLGLAHGWLLWMGDILLTYALYGFAALLFLRLSGKALMVWGTAFFILPVIGEFLLMVSLIMSGMDYFEEFYIREWREYGEWLAAAYATGTVRDILQARMSEWGLVWSYGIWTYFPKLFGIFLFGLAAGRAGLLEKVSHWRGTARKLVWAALPLGLLLSLAGPVVWHFSEPFHMPLLTATLPMFVFGGLLLSFSYLVLLEALASGRRFQGAVRALAGVGRMALSNYLLQSVAANFLFVSVALGLYGQVTAQAGVGIALSIFAGQVFFSHWWLRRHRLGPCEWAWRSLSYGKDVPLRHVHTPQEG